MKRTYFHEIEQFLDSDSVFYNESDTRRSLRLRLLDSACANLTKKQKCYIIHYYKDGMTLSEIAKLYGVLPCTVSRTLNRARKRLYTAITGRELYSRFIFLTHEDGGQDEQKHPC